MRRMMEEVSIEVRVDGVLRQAAVAPRLLLTDFLRDVARAGGVHVACGHGVCGACTVVVDAVTVRACLMFAVQADGADVQTVASLPQLERDVPEEGLTRLQRAFRHCHALQCGYCTPGLLVATAQFLAGDPAPSRERILEHLNGHLCRCTGYANIITAIESVRP